MGTAPHALITGGSSGIGLALARILWERGWNLTLIARDEGKLESARSQLEPRRGRKVLTLSADVAQPAPLERAVDASLEALGAPEYVITSAGAVQPGRFSQIDLETHEQAMRVNYFGTLHTIQSTLPALRERGRGRLIMISSAAALVGVYGYSAYSPSKFALRGLASVLRSELRPDGIGVSIAFPPNTDTPQLTRERLTLPEETALITAGAKTWSPEKVAHAILDGAANDRFAITPGWEATLLATLNGLIDRPLRSYFDYLVGKVHRRRRR